MAKEIFFSDEARSALKAGVDKLANAVKSTLGPQGRNVIIGKKFGNPHVTKDGVTVAKEIELEDPLENIGAQMVKEVASKTADVAGDGTTTATLLAQAIFTEGLKNVTAGANPTEIKRGLDKTKDSIIKHLESLSREVADNAEIARVGSISANNDPIIGSLIAEAMDKVGNDGVITVEEAKGTETFVETVDGMQFDRGYLSPYFITNPETMKVEMEKAHILLVASKISNMKDLLPILEKNNATKTPLVIIAEEIEGEALSTLVLNKMRGILPVAAVRAPGFGDSQQEIMNDIAVLTGATVISDNVGIRLEQAEMYMLGKAKSITITKDNTTIVDGAGNPQDIEARIQALKTLISKEKSDYAKDQMKQRMGKLSNGVGVIHVGAASEMEMKEIKDRIDDALHATRAAVEEGIVPGGGVALIRSISLFDNTAKLEGDQQIGANILLKAIEAPLRTIVENAGLSGDVILNKVKEGKGNFGFNAKTEQYVEDMVKEGIIDPTKVTKTALENAVSVAGLLLMTETTITDIKEDIPQMQMHPGMPGMM